jgi:hypothetical protein
MTQNLKEFEERLALFTDRFGDRLPLERRRRLIDTGLRLRAYHRSQELLD